MELVKRILEILEKSGLTPSEFADKIEVQRSAISHITSGRNKPSLEFLIKIKNAFPEIDTDWLIFGTEKIEDNSPESDVPLNPAPTLFDLENEREMEPKEKIQSKELVALQDSKKIKKIVFFYEDGSFEDFFPNEN